MTVQALIVRSLELWARLRYEWPWYSLAWIAVLLPVQHIGIMEVNCFPEMDLFSFFVMAYLLR